MLKPRDTAWSATSSFNLSTGFVYDCLYDAAAELDMAAHRAKVLRCFSGTVCVDELHLGQYTLAVSD
jgi:hypothetical protein